VKHAYFGELRADDGLVSWEGVVHHAGRAIKVELECEEDIDPAQLDAAARFARDVARFDALAREALALDEDEELGVPRYIEHHVDALPDAAVAKIFGCARHAITRDRFLSKLVLARVWFVPEDDDELAIFDYSIAPELTDYVLAVKFDARGRLATIAVES
jgi:hypothetical protein